MRTGYTRSVRGVLAGLLLFGGAATASVLIGAPPASAATLTVTDCSGSSTDTGSFPYAVANASPGDIITFAASLSCPPTSPITLASTLDITNSVTIAGPGNGSVVVSGAETIYMPGSTVDISGLSFENVDFYSDAGGTLTLSNCTLSHIQGINIEDGNTNVTDSTITDSSSPYGGAILAYYGTVNVTDSTLSGNSAGYVGGAIANNGGHVIVTDSTLSGNTGNVGGAIGNTYGGTVNVSNSTLFDNTSVSEGGGGIFSNGGTVTVLSSTISMNSAPAGSNSALLGGGALFSSSGTVSVGASILAGSTSGGECSGVVTDDGFNLADDESCGLAQSTDVVSANPDLGPLANNGGATNTLLPPSNSPAVGKIPSAPSTILNGAQVCPRTDQRGVASFGKCTIGAVEGGFLITTSSLPNATPSRRYGPVTLATQEAGASVSPYVTTIKWKKVNLPKGLKLSSVGVLSGTPSRSLAAGPSSVTAQVTETVTTLKGRMKVKTKTTVQATIPLTIT